MKFVLFVAVAVAVLLLCVEAKQGLWIPASCMTRIRFLKQCRAVSGSLAVCDKVEVEYHCLSVKQGESGKVEVEQ